jgi:Tfp pilus assembly protein PilF
MSAHRLPILLCLALIAVSTILVYLSALPGEFLWDDVYFITNNVFLRDWSHLPEIFTGDVAAGSGMRYNYYRPLTIFTYLLDHTAYGLDRRGYHLSNILFHLLTAVSVFFLARRLSSSPPAALLAALFFAVHPIQTETVAYISGRPDSLVALFMILAFLLYLRQENGPRAGLIVPMTLCYLLAALSRENCIVLPALILWYHLVYRKRLRPALFLPFAVIALVYVFLRMLLVDPARVPNTMFQRLPGFFAGTLAYGRLLAFPVHLHQEYGLTLFSWFDTRVLAGMALAAAVLLLALRFHRRRPIALFAVGWFFIALLPVAGIYPIKASMAEHWLHVSSIGFFIVLARGLSSLAAGRFSVGNVFALGAALAVFWGTLTARQNLYFRDQLTFYERTVRYNPSSARLLNNLGIVYYDLNRTAQARSLFARAVEIDPEYPEGYNNLGHTYYREGNYPRALGLFRKALSINPRSADALNNIAVILCAQGNYEEGAKVFRKAAECNPYDPSTRYNLGLALARIGKTAEAEEALLAALAINPALGSVHERLARLYVEIGDSRRASFHAARAAELGEKIRLKAED